MQSGNAIGFFLASLVWLFVGQLGADAWRYMFLIGVLPGALTFWIRTSIPEPEVWQRSNAQRRAAFERKRSGSILSAADHTLTRFTVADLFVEPEVRRPLDRRIRDVACYHARLAEHLELCSAVCR